MASIPYALSVHHFISTYGAYAGLAAIVGLAILVLLFFSQARDGANLRQRAEDAEEELHSLQSYVSQLSRALEQLRTATSDPSPLRVAPPPAALAVTPAPSREVPAPSPTVARAPNPAVGAIPFAPAGVGAPALSSATRLIPAGVAEQISIRALTSAPGVLDGDEGLDVPGSDPAEAEDHVPEELALATVAAPAPAQRDASAQTAPPPPSQPAEPAGPPPSTAAGGANGAGRTAQATLPSHEASGSGRRDQAGAPPRRDQPAGPRRQAGRPVPVPPPRYAKVSTRRRRNGRVLIVAIAGAVIVAAVVVAAIIVTGSGSSPGSSSRSTQASSGSAAGSGHHAHRHKAAPTTASPPADVTVAVLNSTSTAHLASTVMAKLAARGYQQGTVSNAPDQPLTSTIVGFAKPAYRADALAVAKALSLGQASVQGVSQDDLGTACPSSSGACSTQVVVTLGSDLASGG